MTPESLLLKRIEEELIVISESQHAQARQSCSRRCPPPPPRSCSSPPRAALPRDPNSRPLPLGRGTQLTDQPSSMMWVQSATPPDG